MARIIDLFPENKDGDDKFETFDQYYLKMAIERTSEQADQIFREESSTGLEMILEMIAVGLISYLNLTENPYPKLRAAFAILMLTFCLCSYATDKKAHRRAEKKVNQLIEAEYQKILNQRGTPHHKM